MATITHLPDEIITIIFENDNISVKDIVNFSSTCKRFRQNIQSNNLWEKKFYQRCPSARIKYSIAKQKRIFDHLDFQKQIKKGLKCVKILQYYASLMSSDLQLGYYIIDGLQYDKRKEFRYFLHSIIKHSITYYFVSDECCRIISAKSLWQPGFSLSFGYNFNLVFHCLKQYRFVYKLLKFMNMPKEKQLPEKLFIIFAQYFYPRISYSIVKIWLDEVAQEVLCRLKIKYPTHSIFSVSSEKFSFWRDNNIDDNFWDEREAKQIMCILEEYIFSEEMETKKLLKLWVLLDLEDKLSYYISTYFRIYQLTTIYHSVAKRLGILCALILINDFDQIYVGIAWKPKYNTESWQNAEYFYLYLESLKLKIIKTSYNSVSREISLQPLNKLWELWKGQLVFNFYSLINYFELKYHCNKVMDWMYNPVIRLLEQSSEIDVKDLNIDHDSLYIWITNELMTENKILSKKKPNLRKKNIKFAVGMIVTHSSRPYLPAARINHGVIIGWHFKCKRKLIRNSLFFLIPNLFKCELGHRHTCFCKCRTFGTHKISNQPHYIILTNNNKICYAPQNFVSICPPKWVKHIEIGQYFSKFENTHYVPNKALANAYPYDIAAIPKILSKS